MWVRKLVVSEFLGRSDTIEISFNRDLTILTGRNGAGKTSLLKLIWYVMSGNIIQALKEVPFSEMTIETNEYTCQVIRLTRLTCKVSVSIKERIFNFEDMRDDDGDVIENAEDMADEKLVDIGSSVFLPTFRRIEGGFTLNDERRRVGNNALGGLFLNTTKKKNEVEEALNSLSGKLSNKGHLFVSAISTTDISSILLKQYSDLSDIHNKLQVDMSQRIVDRIKDHKGGSSRSDAEPANILLDSIIAEIEAVDTQRKEIMQPIEAIQNVVQSIFHHGGISFEQRLSFGDAALAINSEFLSAGEKQMLSFIAYNGLRSNCVFLIDEPELSLHVDWQRQMFSILANQQPSNQFVIATHSPFIYSQYPDKEARIVSSRGDEME